MRPYDMRKLLQVWLGVFGASAVGIGLLHVALGPSCIPGSIPVNATMDSEDRFYGSIFVAYGVAVLWCVRDVEKKAEVVQFLAAALFLGGLARIVSWLTAGPPHAFFVAMIPVELLQPLLMVALANRVARAAVHAETTTTAAR